MQDRVDGPGTGANLDGQPPMLDVERLDVYRVALGFQDVVSGIRFPRSLGHLRDQLDRASTSVLLNIAEGSGRRGSADRAHFYTIARGSAIECAAILDIAHTRGVAPAAICGRGRQLLVRIVQMLTRLCRS